ncbi:MAG TPA: hypothetical protein VFR90_15695 [Methylibium sp.]|uniref:hypothetical protein n=1 Tax=Methylibium sp. TaxID=2067992 RepID=UPI002DBC765B|nr:hypothetical protein [Methylibium sp.]HEU4460564.1 hypothetical protein [Methylibium sp.]
MPHVVRNPQGQIVSLHREPVPGSDWLPADDAAVRGFLGEAGPPAATQDGFRQLDADLVRVIEDVVDVLISRQVIRITDLPAEAQDKLFARKSFRERLPARALRLFESDAAPDSGVIPTDFGGL